MYVEVVLWIKRHDDSSVIVFTTAESMSRLLGGNDVAELYKNLTMSVAYNHSTR